MIGSSQIIGLKASHVMYVFWDCFGKMLTYILKILCDIISLIKKERYKTL